LADSFFVRLCYKQYFWWHIIAPLLIEDLGQFRMAKNPPKSGLR
jgi:hypothetical protein